MLFSEYNTDFNTLGVIATVICLSMFIISNVNGNPNLELRVDISSKFCFHIILAAGDNDCVILSICIFSKSA